ncbi:MAG TPA: PAS domain S-box protein, partial [Verrucomicrobiae bacterium]|nr:PAS domain S-box protein [Verrucomicrobiae bacterium]
RQLRQQDNTNDALSIANAELRQQRDLLDSFINSLPGVAYVVDTEKRLRRWNRRFAEVTGLSPKELDHFDTRVLFTPEEAPMVQAGMIRAMTEGAASVEVNFLDRSGKPTPYYFTGVRAMLDGVPCMVGIGIDISARKQRDGLLNGQKRVFEMIATGAPLHETLDALLRLIESQSPDLLCSVLLLDPDGLHLRHGAAPSLPESFIQSAHGLPVGPSAGSCGTAVFRREPVVVEDIATDPLWEGARELAAAHNLRACWSTPIFDAEQRVLGSFAIYYRTVARPNEHHRQLIEIATHTAAVAITKQQQEAALQESELRHRLLGEIIVSFAFAYRVQPDRRVELEWATEPMQDVIGYSEEDLKGKISFRSLIHPEDRAGQQAALDRVLNGHSEIMEFRLKTRGGLYRWLQCYNRPEWSEDEQRVVRIYGASQDITERKLAEEALRNSEERYRLIIDTAEEGIWTIDAESNTSFVNPKMARMLGCTVSQMMGRSMFEFMDGEGREIAAANAERRRQGLREQQEFKFRRQDGSTLWAVLATSPIDDSSGRYLGALAMVSDVTERKAAELEGARARQRADLLSGLIHHLTEAPTGKEAARHILQTADQLLGWDACWMYLWHARVGKFEVVLALDTVDGERREVPANLETLTHPSPMARRVMEEGPQLLLRQSEVEQTAPLQTYGNKRRSLSLMFAPVRHGGGLIGIISIQSYRAQAYDPAALELFQSLADYCASALQRIRAEESLRAAGERLHLLSQRLIEIQETERRHLARELHDEIGQALTATKLNLEALAREAEPAARTKRTADSIAMVEHLLQTVRNLSLNLRPPMLDDLGLVAALRWLLDQHARTTGRTVNFDHTLTEDRFSPVIETACFRVAQEALTNITRHSKAQTVHVDLRQDDGRLTLSVRDDGSGFNVADARRRATRGGSLGLVGMEERVTFVGGELSVTSSAEGTELRAWFPLNPGQSVGAPYNS